MAVAVEVIAIAAWVARCSAINLALGELTVVHHAVVWGTVFQAEVVTALETLDC